MKPVRLTDQQSERLDSLPESCKVIGSYKERPVISYPGGRMIVLMPSGKLSAVTMRTRIEIGEQRMTRMLDDPLG